MSLSLTVIRTLLGSLPAFVTVSAWLSGTESLAQEVPAKGPVFREAAQEVGLDFRHFTGATGEFLYPEIMGSGAALFDYDGDGDLDVYLLQGALLDKKKSLQDAVFPLPDDDPLRNKLFRNQLIGENRLRFVDVTTGAGVDDIRFSAGAAFLDYDRDADLDLFVTN